MKKFYAIFLLVAVMSFASKAFAQSAPIESSIQQKIIKYYPNPATSNINFDFTRSYTNSYTLTVINFMGKKVFEQKNIPSRLNMNLDGFYRGIYIFQLIDRRGNVVETGKFQVIR